MGVGQRKKIQIVIASEQDGVDGKEPVYDLIKQVWAEVFDLSIGNIFTGQQYGTQRNYQFLIDYDSTLALDFEKIIEYSNFYFKINAIERGDRESVNNKHGYRFIENQDGLYWRLTAESISYG